jgi:NADPH:quinone reductase-like Zn-dependent oxidoreductase
MQAVYQSRYGSAHCLALAERPLPVLAADKVLVKVAAASLHPDIWHVVTGLPWVLRLMGAGFRRPQNPVPGTDLSGVVEAVGAKVTRFKPGDAVFGETIRGMQWVNGGAFAEWACAPESGLALKPGNLDMAEAACLPTAGLIASLNLRHLGRLRPGSRVLVNGAAGGVGSLAVQMAMAEGCTVTAVDSAVRLDWLRGLGVAHTIDYRTEDYTRCGQHFDLVLDIPGNHSLRDVKRVLSPGGLWVIVGHDRFGQGMHKVFGLLPRMFGLMALAIFDKSLPRPDFKMPNKADEMEYLRGLAEAGSLKPRVDRVFPLAEVREALMYLQEGRAQGRVVLAP